MPQFVQTSASPDRPLLLLDVDGVINAISRVGDRTVWSDWRSGSVVAGGESWPILFSPSVIGRIIQWHENGLADIKWLADWGEHANGQLRELLGLPRFPVLAEASPALPNVAREEWWKFQAVREVVSKQAARPLAWVDDDLRFQREVVTSFLRRPNTLVLAPRTHLGLTPKNLREIEHFLCANVNLS